MGLSPQSVARWSARRRFTVISIWVVLFPVTSRTRPVSREAT
jgi:hypothetical protein